MECWKSGGEGWTSFYVKFNDWLFISEGKLSQNREFNRFFYGG